MDQRDELYRLAEAMRWEVFEEAFAELYSHTGRPALPVRRMVCEYSPAKVIPAIRARCGTSVIALAKSQSELRDARDTLATTIASATTRSSKLFKSVSVDCGCADTPGWARAEIVWSFLRRY